MQRINFPDNAWGRSSVSLNGESHEFEFKFNSVDQRWRVSVTKNGVRLLTEFKVVEGSIFNFTPMDDYFRHGLIIPIKFKQTSESIGRHNIGHDKDYELVYFTLEEING